MYCRTLHIIRRFNYEVVGEKSKTSFVFLVSQPKGLIPLLTSFVVVAQQRITCIFLDFIMFE